MGYVVRMPQLGMTMEEGIVAEWAIEEGNAVEAGDLVAIIESEKTTNDLTAREDGVLVERLIGIEQPVEPGTPIGYLGSADETVPEEIYTEITAGKPTSTPGSVTTAPEGGAVSSLMASEGKVSPRARAYAAKHGIDSADVQAISGTGPDGAIVEHDVVHAIGSPKAPTELEPTYSEERSMAGIRGAVSDRMTAASRIPQVTLQRTAEIDHLLDRKQQLERTSDLDLSLEDFVLAAVARALDAHPAFNGTFEDDVHRIASDVHVGVAVDVDRGLLTPVLRNADECSLEEISAKRRQLVSGIRDGNYTEDDLVGGTFTVTNLGHFGVQAFDPLLNVPQVAILGIGSIDTGGESSTLSLSLTFDHRPNDGADAARFLDTIVTGLEHPDSLMDDVPDEAQPHFDGLRRALVTSSDGLRAEIHSRSFSWTADEPEERGGENTAPTPVEQFLGSLGACLTLTIRIVADRRDIAIDAVSVDVSAAPPEGAIDHIDTEVTIESPADESDLERVVETAERACYVSRLVSDDIERELELQIERS